jgi:hypothetical protein
MAIRSALCAGSPLPPGRFLVLISVRGLSRQGHSAAGIIRSIEKKIHLIGTRTRDIPVCSIVPQPTTLPCAPILNEVSMSHRFRFHSVRISFRTSPTLVQHSLGFPHCPCSKFWDISSILTTTHSSKFVSNLSFFYHLTIRQCISTIGEMEVR